MDTHRRTLLRLTAAAGGIAGLPTTLFAQPPYPNQPVKLVIPFTAGSTTDVVGRIVGERLQQYLNQPCVVDNRPGAGGTLGASAVVNAPADGHTVLIHSTGHVANAALYPGLKYDTLNDFTPVTMLASMPNVLVVPPDRGFTSLKDFVYKVKAGPQKFVYGSSGNGSASHIAGEKFRFATGIEAAHIPYRGTPQALTDLMGGRLDWFLAPLALAAPLVQGGKLAALAIGAPRRSPLLPQVPTTMEGGFGNADHLFWVGMFVAARTPERTVAQLHAETVRALGSGEVRARLDKLGADAAPMPQQVFAQQVREEVLSTTALIRHAGIRIDS